MNKQIDTNGRAADGAVDWMPQIDGLRALAVGSVIAAHYFPWLKWSTDWCPPLGNGGVRLFFVISGYLITAILLTCRSNSDEGSQTPFGNVRQFYARRFLRIFPLYYLALAFVAFALQPGSRLLWYLFYLSDFYSPITGNGIQNLGHFWSLAVEEQFYLLWPWFVLFLSRRAVVWTCIILLGVSLIWRLVTLESGCSLDVATHLPFGCWDSLAMGCLLALYKNQKWVIWKWDIWLRLAKWLGFVSVLGFYLLAGLRVPRANGVLRAWLEPVGMNLLFAWLVAGAAVGFRGVFGVVLNAKPMRYLGKISYGLYVYHMLMVGLMPWTLAKFGWQFPDSVTLRALSLTLVTIAVATLSWFVWEWPINKMKRLLPYVS